MNLSFGRLAAFAVLSASSVCAFAQFDLFVCETTPGGNPNPSSWLGVKHYGFTGSGAAATVKSGLSSTQVSDPGGIVFAGNEVFIGNRHGNSSASSVSRYNFDYSTDALTSNGTITGNSLFGAHGLEFRPGTNELFVTNVGGPVSRFDVTGGGATANGTFFPGFSARDMFFSADGNFAYATSASNFVRRYDFTANSYTDVALANGSILHNGSWYGGSYYLASYGNGNILKVDIDGLGNLTSSVVANVVNAIAVVISPDGQEMFVAQHQNGTVQRLSLSGSNWVSSGAITVNTSGVGDLAIYNPVPEPATMAGLGALAAFVLRRKKR